MPNIPVYRTNREVFPLHSLLESPYMVMLFSSYIDYVLCPLRNVWNFPCLEVCSHVAVCRLCLTAYSGDGGSDFSLSVRRTFSQPVVAIRLCIPAIYEL
jgi:hypothetical protein